MWAMIAACLVKEWSLRVNTGRADRRPTTTTEQVIRRGHGETVQIGEGDLRDHNLPERFAPRAGILRRSCMT